MTLQASVRRRRLKSTSARNVSERSLNGRLPKRDAKVMRLSTLPRPRRMSRATSLRTRLKTWALRIHSLPLSSLPQPALHPNQRYAKKTDARNARHVRLKKLKPPDSARHSCVSWAATASIAAPTAWRTLTCRRLCVLRNSGVKKKSTSEECGQDQGGRWVAKGSAARGLYDGRGRQPVQSRV